MHNEANHFHQQTRDGIIKIFCLFLYVILSSLLSSGAGNTLTDTPSQHSDTHCAHIMLLLSLTSIIFHSACVQQSVHQVQTSNQNILSSSHQVYLLNGVGKIIIFSVSEM